MSFHFKKFLLVAAMLAIPLHGAAATLADVLCDLGAQMHEAPANDGHDPGTHQDGDRNQGNTDGNSLWHPFHGTVLGGVVATLLAPADDFPFWAPVPGHSFDPFVPERHQRPPLA